MSFKRSLVLVLHDTPHVAKASLYDDLNSFHLKSFHFNFIPLQFVSFRFMEISINFTITVSEANIGPTYFHVRRSCLCEVPHKTCSVYSGDQPGCENAICACCRHCEPLWGCQPGTEAETPVQTKSCSGTDQA